MSIFIYYFSMYFLSFTPLWITVLFIDIKSLFEGGGNKWTEIISIIIISVFYLISLIILLIKFYKPTDKKYTFRIKDAKESKSITAEFLLSYILPLFAFNFTLWDEIVKFMIFFLVFGYLCIRHNYFSANIILEIIRYKMYECVMINKDNKEIRKIVISKKSLNTLKGENIVVKILNNEYCLDLYNSKK